MVRKERRFILNFISRYDDHGFKLEEALRGCHSEQPIILLAHQPKAAKKALQTSRHIDLVLSGKLPEFTCKFYCMTEPYNHTNTYVICLFQEFQSGDGCLFIVWIY